uniref:Uncharacterized protein n=1 Tax=Cannabis sativa TaxID=3483 RepID=A0A803QU67_CANSA
MTTETTTSSPLLADDDGHLLPKSPTASSPTTEATQLLPPQRQCNSSLRNDNTSSPSQTIATQLLKSFNFLLFFIFHS